MKICVYCASSERINEIYFTATDRLAHELVQAGASVVCGGGSTGLMGRLTDAVLAEGGFVKGIIPRFMDKVEWTHPKLSELELTDTMQERKAKLMDGADAFVALPGGTGTLEELLEVLTLKRLGQITAPVVILNTKNYYEPLKQMLEKCVQENFMRDKHLQMCSFVGEPEQVLPAIRNAPPWDKDAIHFALVSK